MLWGRGTVPKFWGALAGGSVCPVVTADVIEVYRGRTRKAAR